MTLNTDHKFITSCFRLIDALGSPSLKAAVNETPLALGAITKEDVARTALYLRSIELEGADKDLANEWFNAIITKSDLGIERLVEEMKNV